MIMLEMMVVEDYDCDGNADDDDLGVTLVYKDTKRNMDFVCDFLDILNDFLKDFVVQLGSKLHFW